VALAVPAERAEARSLNGVAGPAAETPARYPSTSRARRRCAIVAKQLVGQRTDSMDSRYAITSESDVRDGLPKIVADVAATLPIARIGRA
jgi:hypothetical protein